MEKRLSGHTAYRTEYHVVWVTKYRRPILNAVRREYLVGLFPKILAKMPGCEIVECNVLENHVHMVIIIPPKYSVSEVIGRIKGRTSSYLRKRFSRLAKVYGKEGTVWSPGYYVSTVGIEEDKILAYVRNQ
jgi:putative transposase